LECSGMVFCDLCVTGGVIDIEIRF
jgi:hypothetical protein